MARSTGENWLSIGLDSWLLGIEAAMVIALRTATLAFGGAAAWHEAQRMVREKPAAHLALGVALASGRMGSSPHAIARGTVVHYRRRVRANRRRLIKPRRR